MQTFLPYKTFAKSASVLDRMRLGKQRVEAWQILQTLLSEMKKGAWVKHPAVLQWKSHEWWLAAYGQAICKEWINRGYRDSLLPRFSLVKAHLPKTDRPSWLSNEEYHFSHQCNLLRKDEDHYGQFFPSADPTFPYFWPVTK